MRGLAGQILAGCPVCMRIFGFDRCFWYDLKMAGPDECLRFLKLVIDGPTA